MSDETTIHVTFTEDRTAFRYPEERGYDVAAGGNPFVIRDDDGNWIPWPGWEALTGKE